MSALALIGETTEISGGNTVIVVVVAVVAVLALVVAGGLVRDVLAADEGTEKMKEIARAVQEGAAAYLGRQFRTLAVFVVLVFFLLLLLPAEGADVRIGRSVFFVVGAAFSALTGFVGTVIFSVALLLLNHVFLARRLPAFARPRRFHALLLATSCLGYLTLAVAYLIAR